MNVDGFIITVRSENRKSSNRHHSPGCQPSVSNTTLLICIVPSLLGGTCCTSVEHLSNSLRIRKHLHHTKKPTCKSPDVSFISTTEVLPTIVSANWNTNSVHCHPSPVSNSHHYIFLAGWIFRNNTLLLLIPEPFLLLSCCIFTF
jgi:hypothetical protein